MSICPRGHTSATDDFCDECGARIGGTQPIPAASPAPAPALALAEPTAPPCPHCGTPPLGTGRFCENCGFDTSTGKVPVLSPPPSAPAGQWTATVAADRPWFEANAIEGVEFPDVAAQRTVDLPAPQVRIGRRSVSKGTNPELDLSEPPLDPGVSHNHALLTLNVDGVWLVSDLGSTNGTYINDETKPLTAGQSRTVVDGDRIHVGAWTTITLHAPR